MSREAAEVRSETKDTPLDLLDDRAVLIGLFDSERAPQEIDQGMEGNRTPERDRAALDPRHSLTEVTLKF